MTDNQCIISKANQVMEMLEPLIRNNQDYDLIGYYVSMLLLKIQSQASNGK